jgi:hypothetical protein
MKITKKTLSHHKSLDASFDSPLSRETVSIFKAITFFCS